MADSRFQRWSRKKTEAREEAAREPEVLAEPELSPEEQELAINETLPEEEVLAKYDLPDPGNIELGTDVTGFMRKEIPEFLRRKALRGLWRSNPVLAVLDGLNDYDEDYTNAVTDAPGVKTLYKVGQGLIDKTKKSDDEVAEGEVADLAGATDVGLDEVGSDENVVKDELEEREEQEVVSTEEGTAHAIEPDKNAETLIEQNFDRESDQVESIVVNNAEDDAISVPRFRPRMHFE